MFDRMLNFVLRFAYAIALLLSVATLVAICFSDFFGVQSQVALAMKFNPKADWWGASILLGFAHPLFCRVLGANIVFMVTAVMTWDRFIRRRYVPTSPTDGHNAWHMPRRAAHWSTGMPARRGLVGALLFWFIVYPMVPYGLYENSPYWAMVLMAGTLLVPGVLCLFLPNALTFRNMLPFSPAAGGWAIMAGLTGQWVAFCLQHVRYLMIDPVKHGYESAPTWLIVLWFLLAVIGGTAIVFVQAISVGNIADGENTKDKWLARLRKVGEGIAVGWAGELMDIFANLANYQVDKNNHHERHIPVPLAIDLINREEVVDWLLNGAHCHVLHHNQVQCDDGQWCDFQEDWAGTIMDRCDIDSAFPIDPRSNHLLPTVLVIGIPWLTELMDMSGHDTESGDDHSGHEHVVSRFSSKLEPEDFTTQNVPTRVGWDARVKLGFKVKTILPERRGNTKSVHKTRHQWLDHLGGYFAQNADLLLGRTGGVEALAQALRAAPNRWMLPGNRPVPALVGMFVQIAHVQRGLLKDTGDVLVDIAVEDVDIDPELKKLLQYVFQLYFTSDPTLVGQRSRAIELLVQAEMRGVAAGIANATGLPANDSRIVDGVLAALPNYMLRGQDMFLWGNVATANPTSRPAGGGGGRSGGGHGGGSGGGTPPAGGGGPTP